jgi:hypothetical protein
MKTNWELFGTEGITDTGWAGLLIPFLINYERFKKENPDVVITQVKEKYAELRIYGLFPEELDKQAEMATKASNHLCMLCGSPFHVGTHVSRGGYITTMCSECYKNSDEIIYEGGTWNESYDSVYTGPIVKMAVKIQNWCFKIKRKFNTLSYKTDRYIGYVKYFFNPKKYEKTLYNYKKYKRKKNKKIQ